MIQSFDVCSFAFIWSLVSVFITPYQRPPKIDSTYDLPTSCLPNSTSAFLTKHPGSRARCTAAISHLAPAKRVNFVSFAPQYTFSHVSMRGVPSHFSWTVFRYSRTGW